MASSIQISARFLSLIVLTFAWTQSYAQSDTDTKGEAPPKQALTSFPKWSEFPAPPENIPSQGTIKVAVTSTLTARSEVELDLKNLIWDQGTPDSVALDISNRAQTKSYEGLDPRFDLNQLDAYAANLRRRGAPPKPYD